MGKPSNISSSILIALEPINLLYAFLAAWGGTLIGVLPGWAGRRDGPPDPR